MAKFYIVAKEKNSYNLITINGGKNLEDIDLFTSQFTNRQELISYLRDRGYNVSDDVDLFAINKGRKEFYHRDLIYNNEKLIDLAKRSKEERLDVTDVCNEFLGKVKENENFKLLVRRKFFELYGDLRDIILNSLEYNKVRIGSTKNWMRNNYYVGRDAIAGMRRFSEIKDSLNDDNIEEYIKLEKEKYKDREEMDKILEKKLSYPNDQLSLFDEPISYINLTYVNKEKLAEPTSKKVKRISKTGIQNNRIIDKLSIPYEVITDNVDYRFVNNVYNCLTSLPYRKVKWGKRERYEVDFKRITEELNVELNEADIKFLNSLLDTKLREQAYWSRYYLNQTYPSKATIREGNSYKKSIYTKLNNSAHKKGDLYKKAYNFYLIYQAMTKEKENNRGSYGR